MYLRDLWNSCVRRWYVVAACLLLTAGLLFGAANVVKPTYEATSSLVLVPPPDPESPKLNRYLDLGGLTDTVAVLANSMTSEALQQSFADQVPGGTYEIQPDITTSAPIVTVTAKAPTAADSERLLDLVLAKIPSNLTKLQSTLNITDRSQITSVSVSKDPAKQVLKARIRVLGALGAALLLGSALLVALLDGLLLRRQRAKEGPVPLRALEPGGDTPDAEAAAVRSAQSGQTRALRPEPVPDAPAEAPAQPRRRAERRDQSARQDARRGAPEPDDRGSEKSPARVSARQSATASASAPASASASARRRRAARRGKAVGNSSAFTPGSR